MNAQTYTINFQNNNLSGTTTFLQGYKSSKTRICVTVGMMTTGYDCEDILNIGLFRPIFSPTVIKLFSKKGEISLYKVAALG